MTEDVGFVGIGRMGGRMARRLLDTGHRVAVVDRDDAAVAAAVSHGATAAATPAEAAQGASIVICSLPNPQALEQVVAGPDGVLASLGRGSILVDVGTGDPQTARRLAALATETGVGMLDAPVSRGVAAAEAGTLAMMVGGGDDALVASRPILETLATDIVHVGPSGAGQIAKLCNNMLAAVNATALGEVLVAGVRAGIELGPLTEVISKSSGASYVLDGYLPGGLFTEERPTGFAMELMRKDLGLFMAAGAQAKVTLPLSALVHQLYNVACAASGERDWTSIAELYEEVAGIRLALADHAAEAAR